MLDVSGLNPKHKYPRRYHSGYFLPLAHRYYQWKTRTGRAFREYPLAKLFPKIGANDLFSRLLAHPVWPIVLGALIAATGHKAMLNSSIALIVCAVWLCIDAGVWVSGKTWRTPNKSIIFCLLCSLLFLSVLFVMRGFIVSALEDQQEEVANKLEGAAALPPSGEVWESKFTVNNNSEYDLSYKTACHIDYISTQTNNWFRNVDSIMDHTWKTLQAHDGDTDMCLLPSPEAFVRLFHGNPGSVACADVELIFDYSLKNQPDVYRQEKFRFVGMTNLGGFQWSRKNKDHDGTYCPLIR